MDRDFLGRLLGYLILIAFSLLVGYAFVAFILWDSNVAQWTTDQRGSMVAIAFVTFLVYPISRLMRSNA